MYTDEVSVEGELINASSSSQMGVVNCAKKSTSDGITVCDSKRTERESALEIDNTEMYVRIYILIEST